MKDSKDYYNQISKTYSRKVEARKAYLDAIDKHIINWTNSPVKNYLDIGAGDGRRSLKIAEAIEVSNKIVLLDNSDAMLNNCKEKNKVELHNGSIDDFNSSEKFDLITCLWNVLGHFPDTESIIRLFQKVEHLLSNDGQFIFDVNNRYNIDTYGAENVAENIKKDKLGVDKAGWFILDRGVNQTRVYMHNPFDIQNYLEKTNLIIDEHKYIDYETGASKATFLEGQLLYRLRKNNVNRSNKQNNSI